MALFVLANVKTHLGITGTAQDAALSQFGPQCEAALLAYLKRPVESTTVTKYLSGTGTNQLFLDDYIRSITSVKLDNGGYAGQGPNAFAAETLLTAGADYALKIDQPVVTDGVKSKSGILWRINGVWPRPAAAHAGLLANSPGDGMGNIEVVYVTGWHSTLIPADILLALNQMVGQIMNQAPSGGPMESERLDYWSGSWFSPDMVSKALGSVQWLLKPYRKVVI